MSNKVINVSEQRAEVIEKAISIESMINIGITRHYLGRLDTNFLFEVMYDEYFNIGLKINILKKIHIEEMKSKKLEDKLRRIFTIRNAFAHNNNLRIWTGDNWAIVNPKKYDRQKHSKGASSDMAYDFSALYLEFNKLNKEVRSFLNQISPSTDDKK